MLAADYGLDDGVDVNDGMACMLYVLATIFYMCACCVTVTS